MSYTTARAVPVSICLHLTVDVALADLTTISVAVSGFKPAAKTFGLLWSSLCSHYVALGKIIV